MIEVKKDASNNEPGRYYAAGIVSFSFGDSCGISAAETSYTEVSKYLQWIRNVIDVD
jgi:secreted trypsin-like serine protease